VRVASSSSSRSSSESSERGDDDDEDDEGCDDRVILVLSGLRSSVFRVAGLKNKGKLSLARLSLGLCLDITGCISCERDMRLLRMKMSLELVLRSMLLARLATDEVARD
jgi:hypothetical protein